MPSPFPGMDPYLEAPNLWPEVHSRLIVGMADTLGPMLLPDYYVAIEQRTYLNTPTDNVLVGIPDVSVVAQRDRTTSPSTGSVATVSPSDHPQTVTIPLAEEVRERYLEIRETSTGRVITAIELLSPTNKRPGEGRDAYLHKRQQVLSSASHLVEIDLLRAGMALPIEDVKTATHYRILVSRSETRPQAQLYGFNLPDPIPAVPIPLKAGGDESALNLKPIVDTLYDRAGYALRIDLDTMPLGTTAEEQTWIRQILAHT
ncbi:hypothetical protein XM38_045620 [Halomicronema hongdechloris C2206]|uniref:DUF4058 domain-containing protein n=1 Tax=Halomicronema hongdechloris C2206 TaxID=1641165 RepID=A0A1Z3HTD1_9CYAN|nr:DUF4058 family protein [Halomicronema hongdechloris]ASC73591.1 hypothetical protein XM38_045620 [Halomicronema hongdechloris C2206]